jgi:hypothetical protein
VLSPLVHHAAVLGFRNPVIALAPDTVARLSDRELDQVVAHEHAHVRRRDDVAALVQKVIASVLWWHPAVWWLDRALTIEREVACDDWVIVERDATKSYGTCLVKLASLSREHRTSITPAFLLSRSELETRIARLIDRGRNASVRPSQVALSVAAPGVTGLALACATVAVFGPSAIVLPAIPLPGPGVVVLDSLPAWPIADVLALPATPRSRAASGQRVQVGSGELSPIDHAAPAARLVQGFQHDEYSLTGEPPPLDLEQMAGVLPPAALPPRPSTPPVAAPTPAPRPDDPVTVGTSNPRWSVFATGGVAAGRGAQDAAVSTARFFSQFGKSIGTAFRPGSPGRAAEP